MELLNNGKILELYNDSSPDSLFIDPLLDESQIGDVTIDFRLGYDFLVSILTRKPYIEIANHASHFSRGIDSYFQKTRRNIGDRFILYPNQVVVTTTLEYIALPPNVYADVLSRSSYTRLGIHINTMIQPGFRGCIPLELFNHSNNAIELVVGSRICQTRLFRIDDSNEYLNSSGRRRKYYGNVRPTISRADHDNEIDKLLSISSS